MLFYSMLMDSNSWWVVEKCFPVSLCLMWDQIFSIGFKSGLWPGPKHEPDGLVLKPCFGGLCSVGRSIVLLKNNIWLFRFRKQLFNCGKQAFLQYSPVFQSINWLFTVKQLTSTSSWKGSPHHDTSSSMLNCGRDAFTIVFKIQQIAQSLPDELDPSRSFQTPWPLHDILLFLEQIFLLLYHGTRNTAYCRSLPALSIQVPFMSLLACYWWAASGVADNQLMRISI